MSPRAARATLVGAVIALAGCGGAAASSQSAPPCPPASLPSSLLGVDDLPVAGFTVVEAAHPVDVTALVGGAGAAAAALRSDGLVSAALAHYFRQGIALDTANGPVDVIVDAAQFPDAAAAGRAYDQTVARRDAEPGAAVVSTGPIGDSAHGDITLTAPAGGTPVVQYTVTFRAGAVLNSVTVRGRQGGTGVGDAVVLALRQARRQCGASP